MMDNLQWKRLGLVLEAFDKVSSDADGNVQLMGCPYIICTLNRTCIDQSPVQQLQLHHNFHLHALNYKMDAVNGKKRMDLINLYN